MLRIRIMVPCALWPSVEVRIEIRSVEQRLPLLLWVEWIFVAVYPLVLVVIRWMGCSLHLWMILRAMRL